MKIFIAIIFTILAVLSVVGQMPTPTPMTPIQINQEIRRQIENRPTDTELQDRMLRGPRPLSAEEIERRKEIIAFWEEVNEKLKVPNEYLVKHQDFLNQKRTGTAKIFPDNGCGQEINLVTVEELERCKVRPQIIGGGSFFSFSFDKIVNLFNPNMVNSYLKESNIHFINGELVNGKNLNQVIFAEIGDVNLDEITSKTGSFQFLKKWKYAHNKAQFEEQNQLLEKGLENNGIFYSNKAKVKIDTTYILRSIIYSAQHHFPNDTDIIVAFRIIGQEADGSIIILWKKMREETAPKFDK